jgi:type I restriction enzyme, S subunit
MNPAQLLTHFDRISESPDAIPRLRRFILDLAVRGKLVEQDPRDEPAGELVERIHAGKAKLLKEGMIKAQEPQPAIAEGEIEYALPTNWVLTRIGDLLTVIRGASPRPKGDPKYFSTVRTPYHWIKISDIRKHSKDRTLYDTDEFLTKAGMEKSVLLPKGTLVVTNSATIGVPILLGFEGGCVHDGYLAFPYFPTSELSQDFFFALFQTLQSYAVKKARGMAQLNLNTGLVREFPLGLPPLAEQHRIVAKVDELMALCDRLEGAQGERESRRDRLAASSLNRLNNGADTGTFRDHARFYFTHLPRLTTRPEHIQQLRQTILNLAVRGKLVPHDPRDESAHENMRLITKNRDGLMAKGELRRIESVLPVTEAEPFALPTNWIWTFPDQLSKLTNNALTIGPFGSNLLTSDYTAAGTPLVFVRDIRTEFSIDPKHYISPKKADELNGHSTRPGDLLITKMGDPPGDTAIYPTGWQKAIITADCIKWTIEETLVLVRYLYFGIRAPLIAAQITEITKGAAHQKVSLKRFRGVYIPLPPLAEQQRIVAKLDELMALCDRLQAQLTTTQTQSRRLLESVLHGALIAGGLR